MISRREVIHVAKLARLGITKKEEEKLARDLSSILNYVEKLKEVDISKVQPTSHPLAVENVMRKDEENKKQKTKNKELLNSVPDVKDGYIKVKSILK